jgi:hypothetical protein
VLAWVSEKRLFSKDISQQKYHNPMDKDTPEETSLTKQPAYY